MPEALGFAFHFLFHGEGQRGHKQGKTQPLGFPYLYTCAEDACMLSW